MNQADSEPIAPSTAGPGLLRRIARRTPGFVQAKALRQVLRQRLGPYRRFTIDAPPPRTLMLETSALCNLRCEKCGYKNTRRPRGLIDFDLALAALDQARDLGVRLVCLSQLGEPLLHPELERIAAAAVERKLFPYLVTNGVLLTAERSRGLIEAGIHRVVVSLDGWDRASHAARQGGADLDQVLERLRSFNEIRGQARPPWLAAASVIDSESVHRWGELKKLAGPLVDRLEPLPLADFGAPGQEIGRELLLGERSFRRLPCQILWGYLSVGWDGRVGACCNDHEYALTYGNIQERPLKELWNQHTIREWRRLHLQGRFDQMPLCGRCTLDYANSYAFQLLRLRLLR